MTDELNEKGGLRMEVAQRVRANGVDVEQTVRRYEVRDYDDVGPEFICEWLLRHFNGQDVAAAAHEMLYNYLVDQVGPSKKYKTLKETAPILGVSYHRFRMFRYRLLAENR